jgi:hypothetical protein
MHAAVVSHERVTANRLKRLPTVNTLSSVRHVVTGNTVCRQRCEESMPDAPFYRELSCPQIGRPSREDDRATRKKEDTEGTQLLYSNVVRLYHLPSTPFS